MSETAPLSTRPRISPALGIGVGVVAISTASIFARFAQNAGAPSLTIAALRLVFASIVLLPFAAIRCRAELATMTRGEWLIALLSGAFLGAHFGTWITSLQYTSVTSSVVLVTFSPLFVAIGSAVFLKEKLSRLTLAGIAVAILGGGLIGAGDASLGGASAPNPLLGNLLALVGAISIAPHFLIGRHLRRKLSLLAYISVVYSAAAVVLLIAVGVTGSPLVGFDPQSYVYMALLALLPQLVGHTSFNWSLGYLPAAYAAIPALGEPIGSTVLALLVLGEVLTPIKLIGGLLTLGGIALMMVSRIRNDQEQS